MPWHKPKLLSLSEGIERIRKQLSCSVESSGQVLLGALREGELAAKATAISVSLLEKQDNVEQKATAIRRWPLGEIEQKLIAQSGNSTHVRRLDEKEHSPAMASLYEAGILYPGRLWANFSPGYIVPAAHWHIYSVKKFISDACNETFQQSAPDGPEFSYSHYRVSENEFDIWLKRQNKSEGVKIELEKEVDKKTGGRPSVMNQIKETLDKLPADSDILKKSYSFVARYVANECGVKIGDKNWHKRTVTLHISKWKKERANKKNRK